MASILKVDTIQDQAGNNIISENANVITIGASGDTITVPAGATLANSGIVTGFESTGIDDNATSTAITIDSSQRVGIGLTNPAFELDILGAHPSINLKDSSNATNQCTILADAGANVASLTLSRSGGNQSSAQLNAQGNFANLTLSSLGNTASVIEATSNELTFDVNGSERMRIDSSGNVGIGTSSPGTRLSFGSYIPSNGQTIHTYQSGNTVSGLGVVSSVHRMFTNSGSNISFGHVSTSDGSTYSEAMRIDSSGNVGVGLTDPDENLEVQGRSHLNGTVYSEVFNQAISADGWVFVRTMQNDEGFQVFACVPGANTNESKFASALVFKGGGDPPLMTVLQGDGLLNLRVNGNDVEVYRSSSTGGGLRNTRVTFLKVAYQ